MAETTSSFIAPSGMKLPVVIKQSPLVLILRIIQVDILSALVLFALSFLANYEELYRDTPVNDFIRYDIFLVLGASIGQLFITIIVFFWWHGEEYRVKDKEIIYRSGIFFDKQYAVLHKKVSSVELKRNFLELILGYGTVIINLSPGEKPIVLKSIENAEIYANIIKEAIDHSLSRTANSLPSTPVQDLIIEGEHSRLELKQTFRWDTKNGVTRKDLEKAVMKTVAAFLNSDGGHLIIGVTDGGKIFGLEGDFKSLPRKNRDGFENHFNQTLKTMIGAEFRQYISVHFQEIEGKDVCLIEVQPSPKPVYLRQNNGEEEFFIRTGNSTSPLKISEVNSYIESHWG